MNDTWITNPHYGMFGWTSSIQKSKKGTTRITINKNVSIAASLQAGQRLYSYVAKEDTLIYCHTKISALERFYFGRHKGIDRSGHMINVPHLHLDDGCVEEPKRH